MTREKRFVVRPSDPKTVGEIVALAKEPASAIDEGRVFIGKKRVKSASDAVKPGDEVRIGKRSDSDIEVDILVQKNDLVAVAKPAGIPTVPDHAGSSHSLVAVVARTLGKKTTDLFITSRLDREVSGVVLFALTSAAEARLKDARARGAYARRYVALAKSDPGSADHGSWTSAIEEKESATRYRVVATGDGVVMLAVDPITGRTHQIRIHASRARMPLLGDPTYGGPSKIVLANGRVISFGRIALHAARVSVEGIVAEAPIPAEIARWWTELGGEAEKWNTAVSCDTSPSSD